MAKNDLSKTAQRLAASAKKDRLAQQERAKAWRLSEEKIAKLRAQRLTKETADGQPDD